MAVKDDIDNDLRQMVSPDDFGTEAIFKPKAGGEYAVNVILDRDPVAVNVGSNGETISDNLPTITARTSDFAVIPAQGDTFTVEGVDYKVWNVENSYTGVLTLILQGR